MVDNDDSEPMTLEEALAFAHQFVDDNAEILAWMAEH